jgi:hypothetical protein
MSVDDDKPSEGPTTRTCGRFQERSLQEKSHHRSFLSGTSTGSKMDESSFSGLFTFVESGHIVMGSEGKGTSKSRGSGSRGESQRS